ncbi:hypothetical protein [Nocardia carnea]|uniref:hypothetical protein n=1 Tax=Nocardia carnea TaxID=37328 RepID=UPI0024576AB7|nr:hypothetical protein [Nocardia carnea]
MWHFRERLLYAVCLLFAIGFPAGCGTAASDGSTVTPAFTGIVASCAEVAAPAMNAVQAYTGELYSEAVEFEESTPGQTRPGFTEKRCQASYVAPASPPASHSTNSPIRRVFYLRIAVRLGDDPVAAAERHIDSACESADECRITTGIGDESFDATVVTSFSTAMTTFRESNAIVSVAVDGANYSSRPGELSQDPDISDLAPGARAVAEAMVADLGAFLVS